MLLDAKKEIDYKVNLLKKFLPILVICPYTRAIFLAGSTAVGNPKPASDIDLIIISQAKRVWLNRLFLELAAFIFRKRRSKKKIKNRFCFNIFLSKTSPLLPHQDFIGASFYKNIKPVWGATHEIENFWSENYWLENFYKVSFANKKNIFINETKLSDAVRIFLEKLLDKTHLANFLEKISYKIQIRYLKNKFNKIVLNKNSGEFDFEISPNLIAYHFPVSNYSRAMQKQKSLATDLGTVDN